MEKENQGEFQGIDLQKLLETYTQMASSPGFGFGSLFGGNPFSETEKYPYERLGDGYELRPIKLTAKEEKDRSVINSKYCHLYHNDLKVSDNIFRKGGIGGKFKDGYCQLIRYVRDKKRESGFSYGDHVIINTLGEIVLGSSGIGSDHPSHDGGNLAHMKDKFYNLKTGEAFMVKSSSFINGKNTIIVEHRYDWYGKELDIPLGIYAIDKATCEVTKIDDTK